MKPKTSSIHWYIIQAINTVRDSLRIKKATAYVSPTEVVTVTRRHKSDRRCKTQEFVLTIGKPNYLGRKFVKACIKSGEKFPVKRIQIKFYPDAKPT